jgi:hypothetical protein
MPICEVRSPISKPKAPQAGDVDKLPTSPGAFSNPDKYAGGQRRSDALPPRNLSDPDPHPAASRTGGMISVAWDMRK